MTTIAQERAALKAAGRSLRTREQARFRFNYNTIRSVTEPARAQFVHITITNPSNYGSDDAHARAVEAIGISRFPNTGASYNRLIMQSGTAYEAQPIGRQGAHTLNDKGLSRCTTSGCPSRGAAFPGGNLNDSVRAYAICQNVGHAVTDAELDSLARTMAADRLAGFVVRNAPIHGHRCVAYKDCPAARMWARMGELERKVNHYVAVGFGATPPTKDWFDMATKEDLQAAVRAELPKMLDLVVRRVDDKPQSVRLALADILWLSGRFASAGDLTATLNQIRNQAVSNGKLAVSLSNNLVALMNRVATEDTADDADLAAMRTEMQQQAEALEAAVAAMQADLDAIQEVVVPKA